MTGEVDNDISTLKPEEHSFDLSQSQSDKEMRFSFDQMGTMHVDFPRDGFVITFEQPVIISSREDEFLVKPDNLEIDSWHKVDQFLYP